MPISSVEPVILVEGQSYQLAASCRSVARPPPRLSWDTDLNGQSVNRTSDNGMVSSHYSVHPLRNMNGKKLDCLVWHETYKSPQRITNTLVVHCEYSSVFEFVKLMDTFKTCKQQAISELYFLFLSRPALLQNRKESHKPCITFHIPLLLLFQISFHIRFYFLKQLNNI